MEDGGATVPPFLLGGMTMSLFKGFSQIDLLERQPRTLCAILAEQLSLRNKAIKAQAEEIRQLRADVKEMQKYMSEDYREANELNKPKN